MTGKKRPRVAAFVIFLFFGFQGSYRQICKIVGEKWDERWLFRRRGQSPNLVAAALDEPVGNSLVDDEEDTTTGTETENLGGITLPQGARTFLRKDLE